MGRSRKLPDNMDEVKDLLREGRKKVYRAYKVVDKERCSPLIRHRCAELDQGISYPPFIQYEDEKEYVPHRFNNSPLYLCGAGINVYASFKSARRFCFASDWKILILEIPIDAEVCIPQHRKVGGYSNKFRVSKVKVLGEATKKGTLPKKKQEKTVKH